MATWYHCSVAPRDQDVLNEHVARVVRDEMRRAAWGASCLPMNVDETAELLLIGAALHGHRQPGVEGAHFFSRVHQELWECAISDSGDWPELKGNGEAVGDLRRILESHSYTTKAQRKEAADRVSELAARRRLRELMRKLEAELANDLIDCGDAEDELQRHLLKGYPG